MLEHRRAGIFGDCVVDSSVEASRCRCGAERPNPWRLKARRGHTPAKKSREKAVKGGRDLPKNIFHVRLRTMIGVVIPTASPYLTRGTPGTPLYPPGLQVRGPFLPAPVPLAAFANIAARVGGGPPPLPPLVCLLRNPTKIENISIRKSILVMDNLVYTPNSRTPNPRPVSLEPPHVPLPPRFGVLFFLLLYLSLMSLTSLPVWREDRRLFLTESMGGAYGHLPYFASVALADILLVRVLPPLAFAVVGYPLIGLNSSRDNQTCLLWFAGILVSQSRGLLRFGGGRVGRVFACLSGSLAVWGSGRGGGGG